MLGSKKDVSYANDHTLVSKGTKIVGDIHFAGELQVEGQVVGNIIAQGTNNSKLVVTENGLVEGEVRVPTAVINGSIRGDVHSSKHLELAAKAVVQGSVYYSLIEMVRGSQVNGNLVHTDESKAAKNVEPLMNSKKSDAQNKKAAVEVAGTGS